MDWEETLRSQILGDVGNVAGSGVQVSTAIDLEISPAIVTAAFDAVDEGILIVDRSGDLLFVNTAAEEILSSTPPQQDALTWATHLVLIDPSTGRPIRAGNNPLSRAFEGTSFGPAEFFLRQPGKKRMLRVVVKALPIRSDSEAITAALMVIKSTDFETDLSAAFLHQGLCAFTDPVLIATHDGDIVHVNDRACKLLNYLDSELARVKTWDILDNLSRQEWVGLWHDLQDVDSFVSETNCKPKKGWPFAVEAGIRRFRLAGKDFACIAIKVVEAGKQLDEALLRATVDSNFYDPLTRLANRFLFYDYVRRAIHRYKRHPERRIAVAVIDVDRFSVVNDTFGHAIGDKLLSAIGARLEDSLREGDCVARLGDDEFAILLEDIETENEAMRTVLRIQEEVEQPFKIHSQDIYATTTIGIALSRDEYTNSEDLMRDAEAAMHRAKSDADVKHHVFDHEQHARMRKKMDLEADLHRAIRKNELVIHYQPIIHLPTGTVSGVEALVRWSHGTKGLIPPNEFIPLAEETGLIIPIDRYVLETAAAQVVRWQSILPRPLTVSVNFSGRQFSHADLPSRVEHIVKKVGLDPKLLHIEITESLIMTNRASSIPLLNELRALGVGLQIDDFGTGYSSLAYLSELPMSALKIDRSFVGSMLGRDKNYEIVKTIVSMAHNLGMRVIAEGIESEDQFHTLKSLNCEYGQGYLFSPPQPAEAMEQLLAEDSFSDFAADACER